MSSVGTFVLSVSLLLGGAPLELKSWTQPQELAALKTVTSSERDPSTGKVQRWQGVLLSEVLEKSLAHLPLEQKSRIDLIILTGEGGQQAYLPRSVVTKFPVLLAQKKEAQPLNGLQVVIPWTSRPKVLSEEYLPLEDYFVPGLKKIELSAYSELYAPVQLKRRTDPSAMRGEKIFIQNCLGCHAGSTSPLRKTLTDLSIGASKALGAESPGHPKIAGARSFKERDRRAIMSFLEAFQAENQ